MSGEQWWFCLRHMQVEPDKGCPDKHRLGPYATRDEAAGALETAAARNRAWHEGDKDWDDN
ncbi:hypothetical protein DQ384_23985 [Sphaerisporangium album]|uniref:SPOR domain-containing protein n=1 Tax=Sphaerisporangium album TaxID=509200 RepID=A0A367FCV7_9ACTN|nr:hypothetical protein [Sphaerisporangium album]RCG28206.1 hypothetical protein DQ384_23985 [Sphaerisporangium album]